MFIEWEVVCRNLAPGRLLMFVRGRPSRNLLAISSSRLISLPSASVSMGAGPSDASAAVPLSSAALASDRAGSSLGGTSGSELGCGASTAAAGSECLLSSDPRAGRSWASRDRLCILALALTMKKTSIMGRKRASTPAMLLVTRGGASRIGSGSSSGPPSPEASERARALRGGRSPSPSAPASAVFPSFCSLLSSSSSSFPAKAGA
mmetsp:Transcript_1628/g.7094  ORF Transcript_1628/g.7094 Transcript_1628/m.7094 type:complete len:206 (+) Transcript_1628:1516-2133(+)